MWKLSIICSFIAIITGIALNFISSSIQNKNELLNNLDAEIERNTEKLKILKTEWEFHTHPKKLMELAENKLGMFSKEFNQIGNIKMVKLRVSAWKMEKNITKENLLKTFNNKSFRDLN